MIARTRTTRATFVVYNWHRIWLNGAAPVEEWAAEFHAGPFDRVETPRDRVVADCEKMTGSTLSLARGEQRTGPEIAAAACGIAANTPIISATWLGVFDTPCGKADRVQITDAGYVRTYDISKEGMIVATTYLKNNSDRTPALIDLASACLMALPSSAMFDGASLKNSYVPDVRKTAPPAR